jgi:acetate kinase
MTKKILPQVKLVGISDSAFHANMPDLTRRYSIPEADSEQFDIYHFGYHGLSVASVLARADMVARDPFRKVIVCHIGSGVSVTAVKNGKSMDTTMGYAPGSGLLMGSRAGDLPTGALLSLMQQKNLKPTDALVYLQTNSGLKSLAGESDMRILLERRAQGEHRATAAIDTFIYHLQKAIGGYIATLGGVEAIILTATASQRSPILRQLLLEPLASLGIILDIDKNNATVNQEAVITTRQSPIKVLVIKTAEADEILKNSELFW